MQLITAVCPAEHREGLTLERMVRTRDRDARREAFEVGSVWPFPSTPCDLLLGRVARRVQDVETLHLLKLMLKASGKRGVPQGGVISPLLSNVYLNEVDAMLERAKEVTRNGRHTHIEYARCADDRAPRRRRQEAVM
jgi:hypothetical protein